MTNSNVKKKEYSTAILLWLFLGGFAAHRVYVKDQVHAIFWYWLAIPCTLTIIIWWDLWFMKKNIEKRHMEDEMKEQYLRNKYTQN